jgi:hypothetical protein
MEYDRYKGFYEKFYPLAVAAVPQNITDAVNQGRCDHIQQELILHFFTLLFELG